jgi:hypothetical protein
VTFPIENEILRDWLLESFPTAPCEESYISIVGSDPFLENKFSDFLRAGGVQVYDISEDTDVLIVGRDFGQDENDEQSFSALLEMRRGKYLTVYSQEMFLAHWFSGRDPFEDEDVAKVFAEGHPALEFISTRWFSWISTFVKIGDSGENLFIETPNTGILGHSGYTVQQKSNLSPSERRVILTQVFNSKLPTINSTEYMQEWGQPNSKERLKKMADSIAWFCRSQKKKGNDIAASRYEADLKWLRKTFYNGRYNFRWAKSYVE